MPAGPEKKSEPYPDSIPLILKLLQEGHPSLCVTPLFPWQGECSLLFVPLGENLPTIKKSDAHQQSGPHRMLGLLVMAAPADFLDDEARSSLLHVLADIASLALLKNSV